MGLGTPWWTGDAVLRLLGDAGRKRRGNASSTWLAQPRAALAHDKIPIGPYKDPAREGIQAPRVTAQVYTRVTNRRNPPISSLR